jgi:hypothetical protein
VKTSEVKAANTKPLCYLNAFGHPCFLSASYPEVSEETFVHRSMQKPVVGQTLQHDLVSLMKLSSRRSIIVVFIFLRYCR